MDLRKWRRAAAGFLIGAMFLGAVGCGGSGDNTSLDPNVSGSTEEGAGQELAKGRYMETLMETPEGVSAIEDMVRLSDGSAAFINPATGDLHMSKDNGDSWETKQLAALSSVIANEENEVTSMAIAPDGGVFFSYVNWGGQEAGDTVKEQYHYIDKDGNDSELSLKDETGSFDFYLSQAKFTGDGKLSAIMNGGPAYQIDIGAQTIVPMNLPETASDGGVMTVGGDGKMFIAGDYLVSADWLYQVSAGATVDDVALCDHIQEVAKGNAGLSVCVDESENTMYLASAGGLYSHMIGGSVMEKLLDGGMSNLGDPTKEAVSVLRNEDGSFLIAYDDGEIDLYTYDKDAPCVPTKQITVYSLEQNMLVSKAVSMFRKSHPDVYVKQEIGLSGDYGVTEEDAVRNLNTKLLAGEGPDLLLLDQMPVDSYVEKGMLADLDETISGLENSGNFFSNILRAYEREDGLYAVPFRFQIPVLIGQKGEVENVKGIAELAGAVKKARESLPNSGTVLGTYTAEELLKRLYMAGSDSLLYLSGKDGQTPEKKLDKDAVKQYLEMAGEIYQAEQKNITDEKLRQHNESVAWSMENGQADSIENFRISAGGIFDLLSGDQSLILGKISGMMDFQMTEGLPANKEGTAYGILSGTEGKLFEPNGIIGINEKSKEKELSVEFLEELLGVEVQKADLDDGFPVNADAYDKFTENPNPDSMVGFSAAVVSEDGESTELLNFTASWPDGEAIFAMKKTIGELKIPILSDGVVERAVLETGVKVLEGDMGIDEGCDAIVQKIELYLAE